MDHGQYLVRILSTSFSALSLLRESLRLISLSILLTQSSAASLDLLKAFSVPILDKAMSVSILDLLRAFSVAIVLTAISAANLDLLKEELRSRQSRYGEAQYDLQGLSNKVNTCSKDSMMLSSKVSRDRTLIKLLLILWISRIYTPFYLNQSPTRAISCISLHPTKELIQIK